MSVNIWNSNEPEDSRKRMGEAMTRIMAILCQNSEIPIPSLDANLGQLGTVYFGCISVKDSR